MKSGGAMAAKITDIDRQQWVPFSDTSVAGVGWSVCSIMWASFVSETQNMIFCVFFPVFTCVFLIFHLWVPTDHISQKLVELVRIKPYN